MGAGGEVVLDEVCPTQTGRSPYSFLPRFLHLVIEELQTIRQWRPQVEEKGAVGLGRGGGRTLKTRPRCPGHGGGFCGVFEWGREGEGAVPW